MSQIIRHIKRDSGSYFLLYRGGYDFEKNRGTTPYARPDEFNFAWPSHVEHGFILHSLDYKDNLTRLYNFFGINPEINGDWKEVNLSICFGKEGQLVLFNDDYLKHHKLQRIHKVVKTRTKWVKEWSTRWIKGIHQDSYEYWRWNFRSTGDYLLFGYHPRSLADLIPEKAELFRPELYMKDYREIWNNLWNMEPMSLNESWDLTPEQKHIIWERKVEVERERREAERKLEELKAMDYHCDICGAEGADYVVNPYDEEVNGTINYQWLCPKCYQDCVDDI